MTQIVFDLPNAQTPGYLRRTRQVLEIQESQKNPALTEIQRFEILAKFLMGYVSEPADRGEAYDALLDASKEQIDELYALIAGKQDTIPPMNGGI